MFSLGVAEPNAPVDVRVDRVVGHAIARARVHVQAVATRTVVRLPREQIVGEDAVVRVLEVEPVDVELDVRVPHRDLLRRVDVEAEAIALAGHVLDGARLHVDEVIPVENGLGLPFRTVHPRVPAHADTDAVSCGSASLRAHPGPSVVCPPRSMVTLSSTTTMPSPCTSCRCEGEALAPAHLAGSLPVG